MKRSFRLFALIGAVCLLGAEARSADLDYSYGEGEPGYNPWTCIELAQDEAQAIIGLVYLYPRVVRDEPDALVERRELKDQKRALRREQHKRECI